MSAARSRGFRTDLANLTWNTKTSFPPKKISPQRLLLEDRRTWVVVPQQAEAGAGASSGHKLRAEPSRPRALTCAGRGGAGPPSPRLGSARRAGTCPRGGGGTPQGRQQAPRSPEGTLLQDQHSRSGAGCRARLCSSKQNLPPRESLLSPAKWPLLHVTYMAHSAGEVRREGSPATCAKWSSPQLEGSPASQRANQLQS